ncbi:DedA family protein [Pseudomonas chlororaphis]|uniref:DedA family protein n=1 Tax=Pseudomonas chlororaphis TaxID=587753 RepID=UPI0023671BE8|nr:DedA family protein [Pseudomonas chlororaphis]WDG51464.1 DedA family protein [Pseudomonas chlororaphis]WDH87520.1 DedA family protein [Pseudomonas chlororaphis]
MFEHLDLHALLATYGYWVIVLGCLLEGETVLILGGMAAHQQVLDLWMVIAVATVSGMFGDQLLFWNGRHFGGRLLPRLKGQQAAIERVTGLIRRYPSTSVLAVRFMYGMRWVGPVVIGASGLSPLRFTLLNMLGALLWATLFVCGGYWAGDALEHLFGDLKPYRLPIVLGVVVLVVLIALLRQRRAKARNAAPLND